MTISELPEPNHTFVVGEAARAKPATLATVVVVADDGWWSATTTASFADNGILVHLDPTGASAFADRGEIADAAIVHMGLSARPAIEVFAAWRARSSGALLAIASRTDDEATVLSAYAAGADHVASFDASPRHLVAHLRSLLRRLGTAYVAAPVVQPVLRSVQLVGDAGLALIDGQKVELTSAEFEFLQLLIKRGGRIVQRAELRTSLDASDREVDFFVRRLRDKLERVDGQRRIVAVRGVGFRFDPGQETDSGLPAERELLQGGAPA